MKILTLLAVASMAAAAIPAFAQSSPPRDVGSMAYPTPLPQGNLATTSPGKTRDAGNMAYPSPLPQGNIGGTAARAARTPTDTGSMAYPSPLPQGTVGAVTTGK